MPSVHTVLLAEPCLAVLSSPGWVHGAGDHRLPLFPWVTCPSDPPGTGAPCGKQHGGDTGARFSRFAPPPGGVLAWLPAPLRPPCGTTFPGRLRSIAESPAARNPVGRVCVRPGEGRAPRGLIFDHRAALPSPALWSGAFRVNLKSRGRAPGHGRESRHSPRTADPGQVV